jgi:hypothetical protein
VDGAKPGQNNDWEAMLRFFSLFPPEIISPSGVPDPSANQVSRPNDFS